MSENPRPTEESFSAVVEGPPSIQMQTVRETAFEKRRGVSKVEVRQGYVQVHIANLGSSSMERRLDVLDAVSHAGVSIDFLKLTPGGLSFMAEEAFASSVKGALDRLNLEFDVLEQRHIVLVHAVNMRDEAGLIADVMKHAIASGAHLEYVTDMHNRMLIVVAAEESDALVTALRQLERSP